MHKQETVTTFGVRRTESSPAIHSNKENENNSKDKLKVTKPSLLFIKLYHYNNSQKLPPKYTGSKQLVTQLLNLMAYHFVQSEHRNMIANMENSTTSNVNERPSVCVYSQPRRWDARPT